MTDAKLERLALLVEEASEVQQIAMKIVRHDYESHHPFDDTKTSNRELLEKELGDLLFAIRFMIESGDVNKHTIRRFRDEKRGRIQQYLHHNRVQQNT